MKHICPQCKKEVKSPDKTWKYGIFMVEACTCGNCQTYFRDYINEGKHAFTLKRAKGKKGGLVKV